MMEKEEIKRKTGTLSAAEERRAMKDENRHGNHGHHLGDGALLASAPVGT